MSDVTEIAAEFARQIVAGNTDDAHAMLSARVAAAVATADLRAHFDALSDDMGGITGVGQPMVILEDWPEKTADDLAIVYVPLEGDMFSEAITVTVSRENDTLRISHMEWGRP